MPIDKTLWAKPSIQLFCSLDYGILKGLSLLKDGNVRFKTLIGPIPWKILAYTIFNSDNFSIVCEAKNVQMTFAEKPQTSISNSYFIRKSF